MIRRGRALVLVATLATVACAEGSRNLVVSVRHPATLPARAFPNVWVVSSRAKDDMRVARAFAKHLRARETSRVQVVSRPLLAARRAEGKVHAATVVIELAVHHELRSHAQWGTEPELLCDELGCESSGGDARLDVERVVSRLSVRVSDGATNRELQRLTLRVLEQGSTFIAMRRAAVTHLIERLQVLSEQRARRMPIELYAVDLEGMTELLDQAEEGRWERARAGVEALAKGRAAARLPAPQRAVFLYDLAQIRRFSGREPTLDDLKLAHDALVEATRLSRQRRYRRALESLAHQHEATLRVLEQRAAALHNFELAATL